MSSTSPRAGQLRRWHTSNIDRERAGQLFLVLGPDFSAERGVVDVLMDMEYFLVLMGGVRRSFSRSLLEGWSDEISEAG